MQLSCHFFTFELVISAVAANSVAFSGKAPWRRWKVPVIHSGFSAGRVISPLAIQVSAFSLSPKSRDFGHCRHTIRNLTIILGAFCGSGVAKRRIMAWQIYFLDHDDHRQRLSVPSAGEAVALGSKLQSDGLVIETIQADSGTRLTSRDVKRLSVACPVNLAR